MPPRIATSSLNPRSSQRPASKKHRKRHLDAFAIAGKVLPEKSSIRSHRLGVAEEEEPRTKRRRTEDADETDGSEEEDGEAGARMRRLKKSKMSQDHDDDVEFGSDSEGNEWVAGGMLDDDDDESINSDEAFGESDEERFDSFTFRGSSSNTKSQTKASSSASRAAGITSHIDLNEAGSADEEFDDDFGQEGVDLATMLDDNDDDDDEAAEEEGSLESQGSEDGDESSYNVSDASDSATEDDLHDQDMEKHARLQDFVEGLDRKEKAQSLSTEDQKNYSITMEDLLEDADLDSKTMATLKPKRKSKAPQMVKPLLPKRQQDAINREVATKKAKEQLDRWRDTVIHNRRAEFLSFPLKHSDESGPRAKDTFATAEQSGPATDLEASIHKIMEESGMLSKTSGEDGESDLLKAEALAVKDMPVEEVLRRRAELRRSREFLFREEIKAKRIAKIKSKSYRRVHRKERERLADKERMLRDPERYANGVLDDDEQDIADRRRAEARMNAKHKTSKWAKSLHATDRIVWDTDARDGVIDMARRQEELRRRIAGKDIHENEDGSSSDDNEDDVSAQLDGLQAADTPETHGLAGMKFMRAAEDKRRKRNAEALAEIENELSGDHHKQDDEIEDEGLGRAVFGPRPTTDTSRKLDKQSKIELEEGGSSDDDSRLEPSNADEAQTLSTTTQAKSKANRKADRRDNPIATSLPREKPTLQLNQPSKLEDLSVWLSAPREKQSKRDRKLAGQDESAIISTDLSSVHTDKSPPHSVDKVSHTQASSTTGWTKVQHETSHESGDDEDLETPLLTRAEQNAAFHVRAFAGDNVVANFNAEKEALAVSEDEKEVNSSMPGWGSWTGAGLTKSVRRIAQRARHNPLYKTKVPGTRASDRKDAKLDNVIISERNERKGKKYLAPILPHQFERKEEYERSLRMPVGPEWVTKEVFQRNTRPRVVVKPGTIIEPISRPLV